MQNAKGDVVSKKLIRSEGKPKGERNLWRQIKNDWQLYVLLILPLAFALLFKYGPMLGLVISFEDFNVRDGIFGSDWVGFDIFIKVFASRDFTKAVRNTLLLNVLDLICGFPMPIILALLINEVKNKLFKRINQTILYLPHFLSWVIIGSIAYSIFGMNDGLINGLLGTKIPFLQSDIPWLISYVLIGVWQTMGWGTIIYLAAITSVNPELYEAATVDGAGRWKQCLHVTLPCIRSTIIILLIMNLGKIMGGSFERIYALQNVATTEFTTTIPVLVYRWGIQGTKLSESTALGLFQSLIGLILVISSNWFSKKMGEEGLF